MRNSKITTADVADVRGLPAPSPGVVYWLVSFLLVFPLFRLVFRGRTTGNARVPMHGPLVVVANHGSHLDPPLLGHALGRPVAFMAKAELFRIPLLGRLIRACGAYPVNRGASDREAIRTATAKLQEGWAIGVFLDGTRQPDGRVNTPMPGAALLAARSGAPLLPVASSTAIVPWAAVKAFLGWCRCICASAIPSRHPRADGNPTLKPPHANCSVASTRCSIRVP